MGLAERRFSVLILGGGTEHACRKKSPAKQENVGNAGEREADEDIGQKNPKGTRSWVP